MDFLQDVSDEPMIALKRRASDAVLAGSSRSLDSSGLDLSASSSAASGGSAPNPAPILIPTPSIEPSSLGSDDGAVRCEASSPYTNAEVISILRAEKLVLALRERFDCQPDRFAEVQRWLRLWLQQKLSTEELDGRVQTLLRDDHPEDLPLLQSFRWFVQGSLEFHEQQVLAAAQHRAQSHQMRGMCGSAAASPRSVHSTSESALRSPARGSGARRW